MTIRPHAYLIGVLFSVPLWVIIISALRGTLSHSYLVDVAILAAALMTMFFVAGVLGIFHAYVTEHRSERMRHLRQQIALERLLEGGSKTWEDAA